MYWNLRVQSSLYRVHINKKNVLDDTNILKAIIIIMCNEIPGRLFYKNVLLFFLYYLINLDINSYENLFAIWNMILKTRISFHLIYFISHLYCKKFSWFQMKGQNYNVSRSRWKNQFKVTSLFIKTFFFHRYHFGEYN